MTRGGLRGCDKIDGVVVVEQEAMATLLFSIELWSTRDSNCDCTPYLLLFLLPSIPSLHSSHVIPHFFSFLLSSHLIPYFFSSLLTFLPSLLIFLFFPLSLSLYPYLCAFLHVFFSRSLHPSSHLLHPFILFFLPPYPPSFPAFPLNCLSH